MNIKKLIVSNLVLSMVFACGVATVSLEACEQSGMASEKPEGDGGSPVVLFQREVNGVPVVEKQQENGQRDQQLSGLVKAEKGFKDATQAALVQHAKIGGMESLFGTLKKVCVPLCVGSALVWGGLSLARFKGIHILCKRLSLFRVAGLATGLGAVLFSWLGSWKAGQRDKQVITTVTPAFEGFSKVLKELPRTAPAITDEAGKARLIEETNMLCCMEMDYRGEEGVNQELRGYERGLKKMHSSIQGDLIKIVTPLTSYLLEKDIVKADVDYDQRLKNTVNAEETRNKYLALPQPTN